MMTHCKKMMTGAFLAMGLAWTGNAQETKALSLADFTNEKGGAPSELWSVDEAGVIRKNGKGGNLITKGDYKDFIFEWDWKILEGGNSGVKYWVNPFPKNQWLGIEYQMIDDDRHKDAKSTASHSVGSIYDIKAPTFPKVVKAPGQWNTSRVEVKDGHIKHFLNGSLVVEADTQSEAWSKAIAASKFKKNEGFAPGKGKIMLQDHNDEVFFKNLKLTVLK